MAANEKKVAVITGAGTGIGKAASLRLASAGWSIALLGRRVPPLQEVAEIAGNLASFYSVDVADPDSVNIVVNEVLQKYGQIDALVTCAGINIPERSWRTLTLQGYRDVMRTNLDGAFHCIQAVFPAMRARGSGTIVAINSEAGMKATDKAGVAYNASKFGLAGLVQSINAEERANGIRACSIFPGDVNTPLLDQRPSPPPAEIRAAMVQPEDVAECIYLVVTLPPRAIVEDIVIRPAY